MSKPLYALGLMFATTGGLKALSAAETSIFEYLSQHVQGDRDDLSGANARTT